MRHIATAMLSFAIVFAGFLGAFSPPATATTARDFTVELVQLGTYHSGIFAEGGAEIVAHDPDSQRLFVVNAQAVTIDILDISNPAAPAKISTINASSFGGGVNSVSVHEGVVAAAIENVDKQDPGSAVFFDIDGNYLSSVTVGALPDMITFTPDGKSVLVANEGEPLDYCVPGTDNDSEGSVSIIDLKNGAENLAQDDVKNVGFAAFNDAELDPSIRVFGPNATVAQDFEPEYVAVSPDSKQAWVTLQENNAIAVIDIKKAEVTELFGLGFKDHSAPGNGIDASDRDGSVNITSWPVNGLYMPDAIDAVKIKGKEYLVTANEGDAREYDCFAEEARVKDLDLDPRAFPDAEALQEDENIGRLTVTAANGDTDGDGDYDELHPLGARSFSIWDENGMLVFDSGQDFEEITASAFPEYFNADNEENGPDTFDSRSDNKGPEPEALVAAEISGKIFAFVGLERIGGVMVYDISNVNAPEFVQYSNNRNFTADIESEEAGDLGPEGMTFIDKKDSPTNKPLLVVSNEISGTTTVYEVQVIE